MGRETSVYDKNNFNVSNNYYPVDSAIAMRDFNGTDLQVTVLNDRPQGGSGYLNNNTIELMQHRRATDDDGKGVLEALNETDKNEFGVQVSARYFVQIFDFKRARSLQRSQQILVDQPLEVMYSLEEIDVKNLSKASKLYQHKSLIQL